MSLSYYRLRPPVTSLRATATGPYVRLSVWVERAFSGELVLPMDFASEFMLAFAALEYGPCLHTHHGGQERGLIVDVYDRSLLDDTTVISACGGISTVGEVKVLAGAGRSKSNGPV